MANLTDVMNALTSHATLTSKIVVELLASYKQNREEMRELIGYLAQDDGPARRNALLEFAKRLEEEEKRTEERWARLHGSR